MLDEYLQEGLQVPSNFSANRIGLSSGAWYPLEQMSP